VVVPITVGEVPQHGGTGEDGNPGGVGPSVGPGCKGGRDITQKEGPGGQEKKKNRIELRHERNQRWGP